MARREKAVPVRASLDPDDLDPIDADILARLIRHGEKVLRENGRRLSLPLELIRRACVERSKARIGDQERPGATFVAADSRLLHDQTMLLTIDETADHLRVGPRQTQRLIASGELASVVVGTSRRVRRSDLEDFVAALGPSPRRRTGLSASSGPGRSERSEVLPPEPPMLGYQIAAPGAGLASAEREPGVALSTSPGLSVEDEAPSCVDVGE